VFRVRGQEILKETHDGDHGGRLYPVLEIVHVALESLGAIDANLGPRLHQVLQQTLKDPAGYPVEEGGSGFGIYGVVSRV